MKLNYIGWFRRDIDSFDDALSEVIVFLQSSKHWYRDVLTEFSMILERISRARQRAIWIFVLLHLCFLCHDYTTSKHKINPATGRVSHIIQLILCWKTYHSRKIQVYFILQCEEIKGITNSNRCSLLFGFYLIFVSITIGIVQLIHD
jgi:hypothetical protein